MLNTLSNDKHTIQELMHYPQANALSNHRCVGHAACPPEGREGRSQAGPKGRQLEVALDF